MPAMLSYAYLRSTDSYKLPPCNMCVSQHAAIAIYFFETHSSREGKSKLAPPLRSVFHQRRRGSRVISHSENGKGTDCVLPKDGKKYAASECLYEPSLCMSYYIVCGRDWIAGAVHSVNNTG